MGGQRHAGPGSSRRAVVAGGTALLASAVGLRGHAAESPVARAGVVSLLGDSVRVAARDTQEALFKDVGADAIVLAIGEAAIRARHANAETVGFKAGANIDIEDQVAVGLVAARRAELPGWITQLAQRERLSHLLLVTCHSGPVDMRTALGQVVPTEGKSGIGFHVSGSGRTMRTDNEAHATGYLAPYVQLRLTWLDLAGPKALRSVTASDGFIVGAPKAEAPDPWRFLDRAQKAQALQSLLKTTMERAARQVLEG